MNQKPIQQKIEDTLLLLQKCWVLVLFALYAACLYNEFRFPGLRQEPLEGEEVLWKMQRVLYMGLLGIGLLTDIVQIRLDRNKAFLYLFGSLVLGAVSTMIVTLQVKVLNMIFQ